MIHHKNHRKKRRRESIQVKSGGNTEETKNRKSRGERREFNRPTSKKRNNIRVDKKGKNLGCQRE
jgi:hypothetical protein